LRPLQGRGIARDFGVKDEKVGLKIFDRGLHVRPMGDQQIMPGFFGGRAIITHIGIGQHIADRHAGLFETAEKRNPDQDCFVIITLARFIAICKR
jgi:hypothetical protein